MAFQPKTECLFGAEDSTKEVWCFEPLSGQQQPYKRITGDFTNPNGVAFSKTGELLVTDYTQGIVIKIVDDQAHTVICGLENPYGIAETLKAVL